MNHRPDVHCTGCGTYCHSLSHKPWEHNKQLHEKVVCVECKASVAQGICSSAMVDQAWHNLSYALMHKFERTHRGNKEGLKAISRLLWSMKGKYLPSPKTYKGEIPPVMSVLEWKSISRMKLERLRSFCAPEEVAFFEEFINSAK